VITFLIPAEIASSLWVPSEIMITFLIPADIAASLLIPAEIVITFLIPTEIKQMKVNECITALHAAYMIEYIIPDILCRYNQGYPMQ